jgi:hypothetical protein
LEAEAPAAVDDGNNLADVPALFLLPLFLSPPFEEEEHETSDLVLEFVLALPSVSFAWV